ncbi:hypothetical protein H112_00087 [Trichophyton rubrum D6]|uniref:Uncharacterized protein n=4 Tax=Trichophyton TaxID=5550 RepID=A0A178F809_TRIRU|nr:uncharacterized protein TERG_12705 [Trichophyton rubrum CBS 118892]EZF27985.1 hypothetical protein H100_00085 [Trichophyton rubrum MR850]EZF47012.1 hypothetical protein H102_00084 [Trichophyton rubrum CBS 100081]EZF57667.1 hypothetical protein H103_00086 [Trichophyton rubrum CBS 288.86]EZF68271.1 hypothetical protein H104_00084 [Trichophyton rubrum CBS 289.86]EZF78941.1 hypothetical protein H105_00076 [Trichophyton soudanense CBS 452.61]EZF89587.1 hypothetical protein H110_00086 [Trichophy
MASLLLKNKAQPDVVPWKTTGEWLRRTMLATLVRRVSDYTMPKGSFTSTAFRDFDCDLKAWEIKMRAISLANDVFGLQRGNQGWRRV